MDNKDDQLEYIKQLESQIEELKKQIGSLDEKPTSPIPSVSVALTSAKEELQLKDEKASDLKEENAEKAKELKDENDIVNADLKLEVALATAVAKVADSASAAKNMFLANVGHELRTPLHDIMGSVDILLNKKEIDPKDQKNYLDIIDQKSKDLLILVNDLLDISRIEAGKLTLNYETVKFRTLVNEVSKSFEDEIKKKKIRYRVDIEKTIPRCLTIDPFRLKQILTNLIGNAIKFTDKGSVVVCATKVFNKEFESNNKIELEISVSDTGMGIPKHQQPQLFKPFSQVQDLTHRQYGGTGLGLAISKRLAEMMEGKIWLEDNTPKGARFCFTMVAHKAEEKKTYPALIEDRFFENRAKEILNQRTINIMVVEDDKASLDILKVIINEKSKNLIVAPAIDGHQAMEIYNAGNIDIILTDIQMPFMDGFAMIQQIRAIEQKTGKRTPILTMTASATPADKERCLSAGADFYITKPVIREDLYKTLDKMIEKFF